MIQLKPGQLIPISVVLPDGVSGKVVKSKIKKWDGTVLASVTLTEQSAGEHLDISQTMPYGVDQVRVVSTVYLSDGVTIDPNNGLVEETYQAILPTLVDQVLVMLECLDQDPRGPVQAVQSGDKSLLLHFSHADGELYDLASATAIKATLKKSDGTALVKDLSGGISFVSPGRYALLLLAADLALLPTGNQDMDIEVDLAGQKHVKKLTSALEILPAVA